MNNLGVEFYRNYVGIDELLRVEFTHPRYKTATPEVIELNLLHLSNVMKKPELYKPYLKTVEDLTDEELLSVISAGIPQMQVTINERTKSFIDFNILDKRAEKYLLPIYIDFNNGIDIYCDSSLDCESYDFQAMLNRCYSLGWHPKAKEYIENGLAVSYKDLNTGEKSE